MRPCDQSDRQWIMEVAQVCHPHLNVSENDVKILLGTYSFVGMSNQAGRIIGFVSSVSTAQRTTILDIGVLPDYRRRGIAYQLVSEHVATAYESLKTPWGHEIKVKVPNTHRHPGVEFYESMGFTEVTESKDAKYAVMSFIVREPVSVEF